MASAMVCWERHPWSKTDVGNAVTVSIESLEWFYKLTNSCFWFHMY